MLRFSSYARLKIGRYYQRGSSTEIEIILTHDECLSLSKFGYTRIRRPMRRDLEREREERIHEELSTARSITCGILWRQGCSFEGGRFSIGDTGRASIRRVYPADKTASARPHTRRANCTTENAFLLLWVGNSGVERYPFHIHVDPSNKGVDQL